MAAQPKIIPLSQPTRLLAPSSIKLGGFGASKDFGRTQGAQGLPQGGGQIVTLPSSGSKIGSGNNGADAGKIVTLPSPGTKIGSGNGGIDTGKITTLPGSRVGKIGERPASKLDGKVTRSRSGLRNPLRWSAYIGDRRASRVPATTSGLRRRSEFRGSCRQPARSNFKMMR